MLFQELCHNKEWRPFVQNWVNEIRRLLPVSIWRHCPGKENPADIPSRSADPLELSRSTVWLHGSDWLAHPDLIIKEKELNMPDECLQEMKSKDRKLIHCMLTTEKSKISLNKVLDCEIFGDLHCLLRIIHAYVMKFVNLLKHRIGKLGKAPTKELSRVDVLDSKRLWIMESQSALSEDNQFETWKKQFGLFVGKDGLYRC